MTDVFIERREFVEEAVDGLITNNDIDSPLPAATFIDWLRALPETDIKALADEAGVSVATFRRVLSQRGNEIKAELASAYDDIKHYVTDPLGWTDGTDDE